MGRVPRETLSGKNPLKSASLENFGAGAPVAK